MRHAKKKSGQTFLPDVATGRRFVEPSTYSFSVDGDLVAKSLDWHGWGEAKATAFGTLAEHPASGLVDTFQGSVTASAPQTCEGAPTTPRSSPTRRKQADFVPTDRRSSPPPATDPSGAVVRPRLARPAPG